MADVSYALDRRRRGVRGRGGVSLRYTEPMTRRSAQVRVAVYDLRGREVVVLVDRSLAAGRHVAQFRTADLASGSYVVRLEAGGEVHTEQITVVW